MSINRVVLTGRLTKDVELRATQSGNNVASFTVAVDGYGRDQNNNPVQQASFINCVAWSQSAKFVSTYCKKGTLVGLEGRLQSRSYDGKNGKVYVTEVVVDRIENLSPKEGSAVNENEGLSIEDENEDNTLSYSDDDIPF